MTTNRATRTILLLMLDKLQRALALMRTSPPPPDMPMEVELLLHETIKQLRGRLDVHQWPEPETEQPDLETLEEWMEEDGGCEATDGCWVEMDATCPHGHPSWLLRLGLA